MSDLISGPWNTTAAPVRTRTGITPRTAIWLIIAATCAADCLLLGAQGMTVAVRWPSVLGIVVMYGLSVVYRRSCPPVACATVSGAQMMAFSWAGAILSYAAMAASPFPMADAMLARADAALGFDWVGWFRWVNAHPDFHHVLSLAYFSIPVQVFGLVGWFSFTEPRRVHELVLSGMLSVLVITPIMAVLPAVGAWSQHGIGLVEPWRGDIVALRVHTLTTIGEPFGIISFPSFHTVLGVLFAFTARGRRWFLPVLVLNLLMIASVMTEGAHYFVDMLSGIAVAFMAIAMARFLLARCSGYQRGG